MTIPASVVGAPALPPQAKGDAAHLTLMMAQVYGATQSPACQPGTGYGAQASARPSMFRIDA